MFLLRINTELKYELLIFCLNASKVNFIVLSAKINEKVYEGS